MRPYSNILRHNPAFIKIYEKHAKITQFKYHSIPPTYHNLSVHNSVHQHSPFSTQPSALSTQYWEIIKYRKKPVINLWLKFFCMPLVVGILNNL